MESPPTGTTPRKYFDFTQQFSKLQPNVKMYNFYSLRIF